MTLLKRTSTFKPASQPLLAGFLLQLKLLCLFGFACSWQALAHGNHGSERASINAEFVVLQVTSDGPQIKRIDTRGHSQELYTVPKGDRLFQLQHAPDIHQLLLSYQQKQTGIQGLWTLDYQPADDDKNEPAAKGDAPRQNVKSDLVPVLVDKDPNTFFFDPIFHKKNNGIYFVAAQIDEKTQRASKDLELRYLDLQRDQQKVIAKNATHPSLSDNGQYLSWTQQEDAFTELKVMRTDTEQVQTYRITEPKTVLRFAKVNEQLNTLLFFSNKERLLANTSRFPEFSWSDAFLPKAHAHSGHKHVDYYGWQINLDKDDLSQAKLTWEVSDIRAFDISPDGEHAAWISGDGLHIVDITSEKTVKTIKNPNYWRLVYIH